MSATILYISSTKFGQIPVLTGLHSIILFQIKMPQLIETFLSVGSKLVFHKKLKNLQCDKNYL